MFFKNLELSLYYPLPLLPPLEDLLPDDLEPERPEDLMLPEDLVLPVDRVAPEDLVLRVGLVDLVLFDPVRVEVAFLVVLLGLVTRVFPLDRVEDEDLTLLVLVAALANLRVE